jgi:hypothetical protein
MASAQYGSWTSSEWFRSESRLVLPWGRWRHWDREDEFSRILQVALRGWSIVTIIAMLHSSVCGLTVGWIAQHGYKPNQGCQRLDLIWTIVESRLADMRKAGEQKSLPILYGSRYSQWTEPVGNKHPSDAFQPISLREHTRPHYPIGSWRWRGTSGTAGDGRRQRFLISTLSGRPDPIDR